MKEEENWRIKYLKFFNSKSYRFPIGGAGYFQWAEFFCQMLVLCIIMIFIALKRHTIRRNNMSAMFFLMQQFMMVMKYVHIIMFKKTKIKSSVYMNDIYVQRFVLYSNILWTTKKKGKRKQQNTWCINSYSQYVCAAVILILSYFNIHVWFHFIDDLVFTCSC